MCVAFSPLVNSPTSLTTASTKAPPTPYKAGLVAGYSDGTLRVFDVKATKAVMKLHPHGVPVRKVMFSHEGVYACACVRACVRMCAHVCVLMNVCNLRNYLP